MKFLLLLLLAGQARSAPLLQIQDVVSLTTMSISGDLSGTTNSAQAVYSVGSDTRTVTVDSTKFYEVCYSGNLTTSGAGNHAGWSFLVDGGYILNLSNTKAAKSGYMVSSSEAIDLSGCFPIPPGTISSASHRFTFVAACVNSCTFGGSTAPSTAYFYVKRDP